MGFFLLHSKEKKLIKLQDFLVRALPGAFPSFPVSFHGGYLMPMAYARGEHTLQSHNPELVIKLHEQ